MFARLDEAAQTFFGFQKNFAIELIRNVLLALSHTKNNSTVGQNVVEKNERELVNVDEHTHTYTHTRRQSQLGLRHLGATELN
jgi:hypothetical protein